MNVWTPTLKMQHACVEFAMDRLDVPIGLAMISFMTAFFSIRSSMLEVLTHSFENSLSGQ